MQLQDLLGLEERLELEVEEAHLVVLMLLELGAEEVVHLP